MSTASALSRLAPAVETRGSPCQYGVYHNGVLLAVHATRQQGVDASVRLSKVCGTSVGCFAVRRIWK